MSDTVINGRGANPDRAMVLAAGRGARMRPITETLPKPLIQVAGQTMLDRALDRLSDAGVGRAVVNSCYLADQIAAHLDGRACPAITLSPEETLLDTGGGIANALAHFGDVPFFAVNADIVWLDGATPALARLAKAWDDDAMDALLLLHPTVRAFGYSGDGDFFLDPLGRARRRKEREIVPFVFTGIQLLHPRLFAGAPAGAFSMNLLYDRLIDSGRLYGLAHDGEWFHVGTPDALAEAEATFAAGAVGQFARFF